MMRQDEDWWMKRMREALKDYSEPPAPDGWGKLEKELCPVADRRIRPYTWWAVAAVMLLAVSGVSLFFIQSPTADDVRHTISPALAVTPDVIPETKEPGILITRAKPEGQLVGTTKPYIPVSVVRETEKDVETATPEPTSQPGDGIKERTVSRPSGKGMWHLPVISGKKRASDGKWSIAASFSNAAGSSSAQTRDYLLMANFASSDGPGPNLIPIENDGQLVFKEGIAYVKETATISEIKHKQPVGFGLSVRKNLSNGFSVESGVTYTMLSSEGKSANNFSEKVEQKLHYIGIPIRGNWNFLDIKRFTLYLAAGGMIEKCVYGKVGSEKQTVKPLQFSLTGAVGGQLNVTGRIGIYVEPGVSYYFDDGSNVETIRKENPLNLNLQGGIRFTY